MTDAKRGLSPTSQGALVLKKARAEDGSARTTKEVNFCSAAAGNQCFFVLRRQRVAGRAHAHKPHNRVLQEGGGGMLREWIDACLTLRGLLCFFSCFSSPAVASLARSAHPLTHPPPKKKKKQGIPRTSSLPAPTMLLSGHGGPVYGLAFSPDGATLASASGDRTVFLWSVGEAGCENEAALAGHRNAVLDLAWACRGDRLVTASADTSVRAWDPLTGAQVKRWDGHSGIVNAVAGAATAPLTVSASDDGSVRVWDHRSKRAAAVLSAPTTPACPVLAIAMAAEGDAVYAGGVDNTVRGWDLRSPATPALELGGHADSVTGLALHPSGTHLLSNAMDNTLRAWDVRPFAPDERCTAVFVGHAHSAEKGLLRCAWSGGDGRWVTAASADGLVHVWEAATGAPAYRLPGHEGAVHAVAFHPDQPIVASAGADSNIFVGELAE
jgi:Prp8 binding protein